MAHFKVKKKNSMIFSFTSLYTNETYNNIHECYIHLNSPKTLDVWISYICRMVVKAHVKVVNLSTSGDYRIILDPEMLLIVALSENSHESQAYLSYQTINLRLYQQNPWLYSVEGCMFGCCWFQVFMFKTRYLVQHITFNSKLSFSGPDTCVSVAVYFYYVSIFSLSQVPLRPPKH